MGQRSHRTESQAPPASCRAFLACLGNGYVLGYPSASVITPCHGFCIFCPCPSKAAPPQEATQEPSLLCPLVLPQVPQWYQAIDRPWLFLRATLKLLDPHILSRLSSGHRSSKGWVRCPSLALCWTQLPSDCCSQPTIWGTEAMPCTSPSPALPVGLP